MENPIVEQVTISQNSGGYRYSVEPFLLAHWTCPSEGSKVLDIGTGCGVIPLLLMSRQSNLEITAVEIQNPLYQSAVANVKPMAGPIASEYWKEISKLSPAIWNRNRSTGF